LAISRAGANTTLELQFFAIPSLLIPLPNSRQNEQFKNALQLKNLGGAIILEQKNANQKNFLTSLDDLAKNQTTFKKQLENHPPALALNAAEKLYQLILKISES